MQVCDSVIPQALRREISAGYCQYVTMGLKKGSPALEQEENDQKKAVGLMNSSLLEDLIKRSQEGDTLAMEAIYERYKRPIFNLVYRYIYNVTVAEDLLQDIFLKIFTHLKDLQREDTFIGWLYRIAINSCYSYLRSTKTPLQKTIPLEDVERKIDNEASDTHESVLKKPLDEAIQHLPPRLKSVFLLHEVQGYKHREIARILGCSVGTSKSQLFKARMKLRQFLKNKQLV